MKTTYSIAKGQSEFPAMVKEAEKGGVLAVTRHDETVAYLIGREEFEALLESLELLSNPTFARTLAKDKAGKLAFKPLEEALP